MIFLSAPEVAKYLPVASHLVGVVRVVLLVRVVLVLLVRVVLVLV